MYTIHKIVFGIIFIALACASYYFDLQISPQQESNLLALFGILFGFTVTAAVAMRGSDFLHRQSKIVDKVVRGVFLSNTQRLCSYLNFSCMLNLFLITFQLARGMINIEGVLLKIESSCFVGIIGMSLFASFLVLRLVIIFIKSVE